MQIQLHLKKNYHFLHYWESESENENTSEEVGDVLFEGDTPGETPNPPVGAIFTPA
jgi:hypothetical protein